MYQQNAISTHNNTNYKSHRTTILHNINIGHIYYKNLISRNFNKASYRFFYIVKNSDECCNYKINEKIEVK